MSGRVPLPHRLSSNQRMSNTMGINYKATTALTLLITLQETQMRMHGMCTFLCGFYIISAILNRDDCLIFNPCTFTVEMEAEKM